ncbi:helix-turn-helix transcriptional regulator [Collinsella tanakaei]|uniref:helix-turn-helix transcriptional regulator n=1 Tax=Collinsella tanakaei TaxID=626935 RepID=UPI0022E275A2|nr:helix-turn-helix transcriptional regulator [Collinsella tanakaei]
MTKSDQHAATAATELPKDVTRTKENPIESAVGARIRCLREAAGMSQGELASRVFVSRQTVINWEKGKTLPDIESVKLLSAAYGITIDALLDERSEEYLRQTERDRRTILLSLASGLVYILAGLTGMVVVSLSYQFLDWDTAHVISNVEAALRFCLMVPWSVLAFRANAIRNERQIRSAVDTMAFLEGYKPGSALPQTFLWRRLLPHWTAIMVATWVVILFLVFAPLFAMKMV